MCNESSSLKSKTPKNVALGWGYVFRKLSPLSPGGQYIIYELEEPQTPVCIIPEPLGGKKNERGRSVRNKENVELITLAPEMGRALKKLRAFTNKLLDDIHDYKPELSEERQKELNSLRLP
jgi:hypothetical protein